MDNIVFALWFFWAAGVATAIPVFASFAPGLVQWSQPMDAGRSWRGRRILGDHKTWRGLVTGVLAAVLWFGVQILIYRESNYIQSITPFNMAAWGALWIGFGLGLGAILGDATKSFFKRQLDVEPGRSWFPFDQVDFIVGGIAGSLFFVQLPLILYVYIFVVWLGVHLIIKALGYVVGINKEAI